MRKELIAHKEPKSPIAEIFRILRTNIQFMNSSKKLKTILVTSTYPGEGKSWISSNLAVAFAQAGMRVVLVDADMRKGRLYNIFGVQPRPGLSNYLSGMNEKQDQNDLSNYVKETEVNNLYVIPAGNIPPNPSELLISSRIVTLLEDLKSHCDIVIIDGTPSKLVTDAVILSRIVDSTIIVTAHNQTRKDDLQKVVKDIQNVGGNIAGVVYNKVPISVKKYNQTYYYSSSEKRSTSNKINIEFENSKNVQKNFSSNIPKKDNNSDYELPKALKGENNNKTKEEQTAKVLREINEYMKKEKGQKR